MANNRMWLVCPVVGPNTHDTPQRQLLAKASTTWHCPYEYTEFLDDFLAEHNDCGYQLDEPYPLGTTIHFTLEYEHND